MGFFASLFGGGAEQAPKRAKNTRLVDAMGRWSAAVKIAGEETEVFKVEHEAGKTTCYIAAEEGKEFEVQLDTLRQPSTDESARLYVDGVKKYVGKQISLREIRPFVFAPIALTDDATKAVRDEAIIKGLGTIRLDVYRVTYKGTVENTDQYMDESTEQLVNEKYKKATLSHTTTFGPSKYAPASDRLCDITYTDTWGSPMYSLVFQYRSRGRSVCTDSSPSPVHPDAFPRSTARGQGNCGTSSTSASPKLEAGSHASSSSATAGKKKHKRKKIELTLPESSDEDDDGGKLRAKIARLEAEVATLRADVKDKKAGKVKKEKFKATQENGKVVLDLLDE
ncbi:hypothetical protein C6P46_005416 [Rhodotorula mucilaginosa]|uniref:DUF7918 domain-containing protein n=1 Tax=Rhodotorula mucilaginosa TaxID=5537 RepID=A0A9P6W6J5_RHOMI|nr:hypothetical protein C6P46_005416 [Rhodotorula mucilaginosa]